MNDDTLQGNGGNDTLYGGYGDDTLQGGTGNDSLRGDDGNDSADGGAGNDTLYSSAGDDTLAGGDGNDSLYDTQGANSLSGGLGNDTLYEVSGGDTGSTLSGGAGQDTFRFSGNVGYDLQYNPSALHVDVVTDFQTGPGGDVLDMSALQSYGAVPGDANPFTTGYAQFVQSGVDTLLQVDKAGTGGASGWVTVLTLQNTTATAFTADNITQGWNPQGTAGALVNGDDNNNTLYGGVNDDTLQGNGGNDTLYGGVRRRHAAGRHRQRLPAGDDGNDSADGGAGNDTLYSSAGDDTLAGGDGNDSLYDTQGANSLSGGLGNDTLSEVSGGDTGSTLSGGAGQDTFRFSGNVGYDLQYNPSALHVDVVTDFQTGAGGDVLDLSGLEYYYGSFPSNANPFTTGYAQFVQSGADTLLQVDKSGTGGTSGWVTVLTLQNTTATAFTADNITQGWNPQGTAGALISGDDNNNTFNGGVNNDTLQGNGGNDTLYGGYGDDTLQGGTGNNSLRGDDGNDSLDGGAGNDTLYDTAGDNTLLGGAGNDSLTVGAGNDSLDGGAGSDTLSGSAGADTLLGGDGNDILGDTQGANSLSGGLGDDTLENVSGGDTGSTLSGGAGQDTFQISSTAGYNVQSNPSALHADVVTDFQTGPGGDVLDLSGLQSYGVIPNDGSNPFTSDYLQLLQSGTDTLLQVDKDGSGTAASWVTVLTLQNTTASSFTADNFTQGWAPPGAPAPDASQTLSGDAGDNLLSGGTGPDSLDGAAGADTLSGSAGFDTLAGNAGADSLSGGVGNDLLWGGLPTASVPGGDGNDTLDGGTGNDTMAGGFGNDLYIVDGPGDQVIENPGEGTDTIQTSLTNYTLPTNVENLVLTTGGNGYGNALDNQLDASSAGDATLYGRDGNDTLIGGAGSDYLQGDAGNDSVQGGAGTDTLYGNAGDDTLSGGAGNDYLYDTQGANQIQGGAGNDTISSVSDGDTGSTLSGGAGQDLFELSSDPFTPFATIRQRYIPTSSPTSRPVRVAISCRSRSIT